MQRGEPRDAFERDPDELNAARLKPLIADALGQLSAEHRAVISRSYYLGRTTTQIADDLHIAESLLKSRLHVALRALQRTLDLPPGWTGVDQPTAEG